MGWVQRLLLVVAGCFLMLFAFSEVTNGYGSDEWLALFMFLAGIGSFFFAAKPNRKTADGE